MNVLQLIYTSCRKGMGSGSGFQTHRHSKGITVEERRELERLTVYVPPLDMPPQPNAQDIDALFPVSLGYVILSTGRPCIFQSRYVGSDFSGRFGNYLAHALVLEDGFFPFCPAFMFESSTFWRSLAEDEALGQEQPPFLPSLSMDELILNPEMNAEAVASFVRDSDLNQHLAMVNAIISGQNDGRRLVMGGSSQEIAMHFAALQCAFPPASSQLLTFNTYTIDPAGTDCLMCGTTVLGGRFTFSSSQRDFEYYVFNCPDGKNSHVAEQHGYVKAVAHGIELDLENLWDVHSFFSTFDYAAFDTTLNTGYDLYLLRGMGPGALDETRLLEALSFGDQYGTSETLAELGDKLDLVLGQLAETVDGNMAAILTRFLFKISKVTDSSTHLENACRFYMDMVSRLLSDNGGAVLEYNRSLFEELELEPALYLKVCADQTTLKRLVGTLATPQMASKLVTLFCYTFRKVGVDPGELRGTSYWYDFFTRCFQISSQDKSCLQICVDECAYYQVWFCELIDYIHRNCFHSGGREALLAECLAQTLSRSQVLAELVRRDLNQRENFSLLMLDFTFQLGMAPCKPTMFQEYRDQVFNALPTYKLRCYSVAVGKYLLLLDDKQMVAQCILILRDPKNLDNDVIVKIFERLERNLPFSVLDDELVGDFQRFLVLRKKNNIKTRPNMVRLLLFGNWVVLGNVPLKMLSEIEKDVRHLGEGRRKELMLWIFPYLMAAVGQPDQLNVFFSVFIRSDSDELFYKCFGAGLAEIGHWGKQDGLLHFIEYYLDSEQFPDPVSRFRLRIRDSLIHILYKMGKKKRNVLDKLVHSRLKSPVTLGSWTRLLQQVNDREANSLMGRFKSFIKAVGSRKRR